MTLQTIATSAAQILSFAILARIITPTEVGILAILSLITSLSQAINGVAFQQASMKYVGEYAGTDRNVAADVFCQTLKASVITAVPFAAFTFLESNFLAKLLLGMLVQAGLFRVLAGDILVYAGALPTAMGAVLGARRFKAAAAIGTGGAILRQCLIIVLVLLLKNFVGLVYAWILSDFAMLVAFGLYAFRVLGTERTPFPLRTLVTFSWPLSIGNFVTFMYSWFDRAILIAFVSLATLGVYNATVYAFSALSNITGAFSNALVPVYSNISVCSGLKPRRRATLLASRYASLVTVPLAFGLVATAKLALELFVGEAYVGGTVPLIVLSSAFGLTAFGLALTPMLTALAKTREILWITVASVLCALASAYILLPFMGIVGASVARGVAMVVSLSLTIIVLKRMRVIGIDVEMAWKSILAGIAMAGTIILIQMIIYSTTLLPLYIVVGGIVYLFLLRVLKAVNQHDLDLIRKYLGSRLRFVASLLNVILIGKAG